MIIVKQNSGACFLVIIFVTRVEHFNPHFLAWFGLAWSNAIAMKINKKKSRWGYVP